LSPAAIGHDREKPGPQGSLAASQLSEAAPRLSHRLLDDIFGCSSIAQHHVRQVEGWYNERTEKGGEGALIARLSNRKVRFHQFNHERFLRS
jgi:hypothetical protein